MRTCSVCVRCSSGAPGSGAARGQVASGGNEPPRDVLRVRTLLHKRGGGEQLPARAAERASAAGPMRTAEKNKDRQTKKRLV